MKRGRTLMIAAAATLVVLLWQPAAAAGATVTLSSSGNGVFTIEGTGISGASAIDFAIAYDQASLANPRVVPGPLITGAMTAVNTAVPGSVRMAIIRLAPVSGTGTIATVTFDVTGSGSGIASFTARLADSRGAPLPVLATVAVTSGTSSPSDADGEEQGGASVRTGQTSTTVLQPVIFAGPSERSGGTGAASVASGTTAEAGEGSQQEAAGEGELLTRREAPERPLDRELPAGGSRAERKIYAQQSILDRFESYRGERTSAAFVALFAQEGPLWCRQKPPVAIADGRTVVQVTFITTPGKKTAADIAVLGAQLTALRPDPDATNTWTAEVVPDEGEYRASVGISQGGAMMVCPLVTAPRIARAVTRADLARYIEAKNAPRGAAPDLNKNRKRDSLDDYIMTANYLAGAEAERRRP